MVGATGEDYLSKATADAARSTLDKGLKGTPGEAAWNQWKADYDSKVLAFDRGALKLVLNPDIAPSKAVSTLLSDERAAADLFDALGATSGPQAVAQAQDALQQAYLRKMGAGQARRLQYKPEVVDTLWGRNPDGTPNPMRADRIKATLAEVNDAYKLSKTKLTGLDPADMNKLLAPMSEQERKSVIKSMVAKSSAEEALEKQANNALLSMAKKGDFSVLDTDMFANAALDAKPSDVAQVLSVVKSPSQRKQLGNDMVAAFARKFATSGENQTRHGLDLWDGEAVIESLKGWKRGQAGTPHWVANMDRVLGKSTTDTLIAASRLNASVQPIKVGSALAVKATVTGQGLVGYVGRVNQWAKDRTLASLYGAGKMREALARGIMMRDIGMRQEQQAAEFIGKAIVGSRLGLMSAAEQSRNDPAFSEQIQSALAELAQEQETTK
jgi:hypothetical protein